MGNARASSPTQEMPRTSAPVGSGGSLEGRGELGAGKAEYQHCDSSSSSSFCQLWLLVPAICCLWFIPPMRLALQRNPYCQPSGTDQGLIHGFSQPLSLIKRWLRSPEMTLYPPPHYELPWSRIPVALSKHTLFWFPENVSFRQWWYFAVPVKTPPTADFTAFLFLCPFLHPGLLSPPEALAC